MPFSCVSVSLTSLQLPWDISVQQCHECGFCIFRKMPVKKGRTCFVPVCKGGHKSSAKKVSLFRAPTDAHREEEWARNMKREDKLLDKTSAVCFHHFDDRYIQRTLSKPLIDSLLRSTVNNQRLLRTQSPRYFPTRPPTFLSVS